MRKLCAVCASLAVVWWRWSNVLAFGPIPRDWHYFHINPASRGPRRKRQTRSSAPGFLFDNNLGWIPNDRVEHLFPFLRCVYHLLEPRCRSAFPAAHVTTTHRGL
uniref:Putative secreted protein n=1 Tax=Anopheles darlingi TaxID=43151 RepID=A0A2M4DNV3_ANODA